MNAQDTSVGAVLGSAVGDALGAPFEPPTTRRCPSWWASRAQDWHPDLATESNGAVRPCLGSAVRALRTTSSYGRRN